MLLKFSLLALVLSAGSAEQVEHADFHAVVDKALTHVRSGAQLWIDGEAPAKPEGAGGCVSCHVVTFDIWSHNAAALRDFQIDRVKLAETFDWSLLAANDDDQERTVEQLRELGGKENDQIAQMLLARLPDDERPWIPLYRDMLVALQKDDGRWNAGGQLPGQKRPKPETVEVTTMWSLLAIASVAETEAAESAIERGFKSLDNERAGVSTEWWVVRMLCEQECGDPKRVDHWRQALLSRQREDGGWGWLCDDPSDALATGQALYGLRRAGVSTDHPAIVKARRFLVDTQREDGTWPVNGTKADKKDREQWTSVYWGAAWSVIGLCEAAE